MPAQRERTPTTTLPLTFRSFPAARISARAAHSSDRETRHE
jgi:hypothetical protein